MGRGKAGWVGRSVVLLGMYTKQVKYVCKGSWALHLGGAGVGTALGLGVCPSVCLSAQAGIDKVRLSAQVKGL